MMDARLLDALMPPRSGPQGIFGLTIGIVTNNQDPQGLGRVKVKLPWLSESDESAWARIVAPMAGKAHGIYFLPEVDDEVLVAFEHGVAAFPYVLGALWNGVDTPPESNADGKNARRSITSRSGHVIRLDDTDGEEKIQIIDRSGKNSIVINTADNTITIAAEADIAITSTGGKLTLTGKGVQITSQADVAIQATGNADLHATGQLTIKGATVDIN